MSAETIKNDLERLAQNIEHLRRSQNESSTEWFKSVGQAQLLSHYYTGLESCFEKVLKLIGVHVPDKTNRYHRKSSCWRCSINFSRKNSSNISAIFCPFDISSGMAMGWNFGPRKSIKNQPKHRKMAPHSRGFGN